ncbi:MAG: FHA domain-containing protein [Syntrophothermus sp.]
MGFRLTLMDGSNSVFDFPVKNEVLIGRAHGNDMIINHPEISGRHAKIVLKARGWYLEDQGSLNGTYFQGKRITLAHLYDNDTFQLGPLGIHFSELPAGYAAPPSYNEVQYSGMQQGVQDQQFRKPTHTHGSAGRSGKQTSRNRTVAVASASGGALFLILLFLFFPFFSAETGTLETCRLCNTEISNSVKSVSVSFLNKDNYQVIRKKDRYCEKCANEQVTYWVHYKCLTCGKDYQQVQDAAPRKNNQGDKFITEGYCSPQCQAAGEKKVAASGVSYYNDNSWEYQVQKRNPLKR